MMSYKLVTLLMVVLVYVCYACDVCDGWMNGPEWEGSRVGDTHSNVRVDINTILLLLFEQNS